MRKTTRKREKPYSVEGLLRNIGACLARDFHHHLGEDHTENVTELFLNGDVRSIRTVDWQVGTTDDAYRFKCRRQMENLLKRFRFDKDLMSSEELEEDAEQQFLDNQLRLALIDFSDLPVTSRHVLFVAAGHCHKILGNYDLEEHYALCRNGKKASVGIPMREATEPARYELPITGSTEHIAWFSAVPMAEDEGMRDYVFSLFHESEKQKSLQAEWDVRSEETRMFKPISELALTFVPKTFKSLRSIMPNTTIGAFYSSGLGQVLFRRLRAAGYDVRTLQREHGRLARMGSITGELVTADQSLASDNITSELLQAILPSAWFKAVDLGRVKDIRLPSGVSVEPLTFMTMGIGFTFALQTLVFLCILKAIDEIYCHSRSAVISVYGDDLIYSRAMHPFVLTHFSRLGLKINVSKTFAEGKFRESCGSDFFAGVDVRPFEPKNERGSFVSRQEYEALLYIWTNGLLRRWERCEVPLTFDYLLAQLAACTNGSVCRVPSDFPDMAGVKVTTPYDTLNITCPLAPLEHGPHGRITFMYLRFIPEYMEEHRHAPYLWRRLGENGGNDFDHSRSNHFRVLRSNRVLRNIEVSTGAGSEHTDTFKCEGGEWTRGDRARRKVRPSLRTSEPTTLVAKPGGGGRTMRQQGSTVMWG